MDEDKFYPDQKNLGIPTNPILYSNLGIGKQNWIETLVYPRGEQTQRWFGAAMQILRNYY